MCRFLIIALQLPLVDSKSELTWSLFRKRLGAELNFDAEVLLATSHGRRSIDTLRILAPEKASWDCMSRPRLAICTPHFPARIFCDGSFRGHRPESHAAPYSFDWQTSGTSRARSPSHSLRTHTRSLAPPPFSPPSPPPVPRGRS